MSVLDCVPKLSVADGSNAVVLEGCTAVDQCIRVVYLESEQAKTAIAFALVNNAMPRIIHWGRCVPESSRRDLVNAYETLNPQRVSGALDETVWPSVLPTQAESWTGASHCDIDRDGVSLFCNFVVTEICVDSRQKLCVHATDDDLQVALTWECEITDSGLVRQRASVQNTGSGILHVRKIELSYALPSAVGEILSTTGHHLRERSPQRQPLTIGRFERGSYVGRPDFDATLLLNVGTPSFNFHAGTVYSVHVGFSGNTVLAAERLPYTQPVISGAEVLLNGEVSLSGAHKYTTPWIFGAFGEGLNEVAQQFHGYIRSLHPQFAQKPRPVILNTWEAVYFHHNFDTMKRLADLAASVGVERFVIDDGWFGSRRDDTSGLGDWQVSEEVWPAGSQSLQALSDHVHSLGMQFGLWFEPEMVNPDSDLYRQHPDWVLKPTAHRLPMQGRSQQVVDLTNPAAYDYIYQSMDSLVTQLGVDYIKWDHNKIVTEAVSPYTGTPAVHAQTLAVYKIFADLKAAHPGLEIESCSSGGGRIDAGILALADRVWASDCVDPVERHDIQRYTSLLVPPEMIGEHIGASPAHSTRRQTSQSLRMATAFFGHLGIEWNLLNESAEDLELLSRWVSVYKEYRDVFSSGAVVHVDSLDDSVRIDGVMSADGTCTIYRFTQLSTSQTYPAAPIQLPNIDTSAVYRVRPLKVCENLDGIGNGQSPLYWWNTEGRKVSGAQLQTYGLRLPSLHPQQAVLFEVVRV